MILDFLARWEDDRVVLPWDDARVWSAMKPTMPWGQIPCLTYKVITIKQNSRGTYFSVKRVRGSASPWPSAALWRGRRG